MTSLSEFLGATKRGGVLPSGAASDLAGRLGVKRSTVSRWLSGARYPSPDLMAALVKLTHGAVTENEIIDEINLFKRRAKDKIEEAAAQDRASRAKRQRRQKRAKKQQAAAETVSG